MNITSTCSHIFTNEEGTGTKIAVKDFSTDGNYVVNQRIVCNECKQTYLTNGLILKTKTEQNLWLNGKWKNEK